MGGFANLGFGGIDDGVYYARRGQRITRWADEVFAGVVWTAQTAGTLIYNLAVGESVMVTQVQYGIDTASDDCQFRLVSTSAINGGGVATQLDIIEHIYTPAALLGNVVVQRAMDPPIRVNYNDGARCITIQTVGNDAACSLHIGWDGWSDGCEEGTTTSTSTSTTSTSTTSTSSSTTSTSSSTTSTSSSTTSTSSSTSTTTTTSTSTSTTSTSSSTSTTTTTSTSTSTTSTSSSTTSTSTTSTSTTSTSTTLRPD